MRGPGLIVRQKVCLAFVRKNKRNSNFQTTVFDTSCQPPFKPLPHPSCKKCSSCSLSNIFVCCVCCCSLLLLLVRAWHYLSSLLLPGLWFVTNSALWHDSNPCVCLSRGVPRAILPSQTTLPPPCPLHEDGVLSAICCQSSLACPWAPTHPPTLPGSLTHAAQM